MVISLDQHKRKQQRQDTLVDSRIRAILTAPYLKGMWGQVIFDDVTEYEDEQ